MRLLTIDDLNQPAEELKPLLERVQTLSSLYFAYITQDCGGFEYKVEVGDERKRRVGIHASEVSKCFRRMVYAANGTERKVNPKRDTNMIMRFRVGTAVHGMLQNDWERIASNPENRMLFKSEIPISPETSEVAKEWGITSSCDGLFTLLDNNGEPLVNLLLEIKTESKDQFDKLREPRPDHVEQSTIYMATLNVPLMWTLYYNKSNSNITTSYPPFLFKFNPSLWDKLQMRFTKTHHMTELNQLPDKEEGMECKWCPFSWTCGPKTAQGSKPPIRISQSMYSRNR